jgi:hypothetical protein
VDIPAFIAVNDDFGVALTPSFKFDEYATQVSILKGSGEEDGKADFYPSLSVAIDDLKDRVVKSIQDHSDAGFLSVRQEIDQFRAYVSALADILPFEIVKTECDFLQGKFGPSNVPATGTGDSMNTKTISEVLKGDIIEEPKAAETQIESKIDEPKTETVTKAEETVVEPKKEEESTDSPADQLLKSISAAVEKAIAPLNDKLSQVVAENALLKQQMEETNKLAKSAQEVSRAPFVKSAADVDLDIALSGLGGSVSNPRLRARAVNVQKAEYDEDFWAGTLPGLPDFGSR